MPETTFLPPIEPLVEFDLAADAVTRAAAPDPREAPLTRSEYELLWDLVCEDARSEPRRAPPLTLGDILPRTPLRRLGPEQWRDIHRGYAATPSRPQTSFKERLERWPAYHDRQEVNAALAKKLP